MSGHVWHREYRRGGKYSHLAEALSVCPVEQRHVAKNDGGYEVKDDGWYGTGSQREYELAEAKPLCPYCQKHYDAIEGQGYVD